MEKLAGIRTPMMMVAEALCDPASLDAARCDFVIAAARERVERLKQLIATEKDFLSDPTQDDICDAASAERTNRQDEIELEKLERGIAQLLKIRDERKKSEDRAAAVEHRKLTSENYESALKKLMSFAPALQQMADAWESFEAARSAAFKAHNACDDGSWFIEFSVDHGGLDPNFAGQLAANAKAMADAAATRAKRDAAAKQHRNTAPEREAHERLLRQAEKASFDAGNRAHMSGQGHDGVRSAMNAARSAVLDGGSYDDAMKVGAEAARLAVEAAKQKAA